MTFEEYKKMITGAIENPDTAPTAMNEVLENIKIDTETLENYKREIQNNEKRIRDLQDTNHKLFLSQVGKPSEEEPEEEVDPLSSLINKLKG